MKLLYLGLRNISSEREGFSGTGTYNRDCGIEHTRQIALGPNSVVLECFRNLKAQAFRNPL
jgi:hypothetical protein